MKPSEILRRASERWERSPAVASMARNRAGDPVFCRSGEAVRWCAAGAVRAETDMSCGTDAECLLRSVARSLVNMSLFRTNDYYPELMPDVWSEAIECAEALEEMGEL